MIELKNINLENVTLMDQLLKVSEEKAEFRLAVIKNDSENAVEEFFDMMQARTWGSFQDGYECRVRNGPVSKTFGED